MDKMNDIGMVAIDLMVAIVLVFAAVMLAILIMPSLSHEDRDWRIKQYMVATRATDNLVQDTGEPGWEEKWKTNYSNVSKIGFLHAENGMVMQNVLAETKIDALMIIHIDDGGTELPWWEFPNSNSTTTLAERENATRALGLEGYNFYIQLHPEWVKSSDTAELDKFNSARLKLILTNRSKVPINDDTVTVVDRYVFIKNSTSSCRSEFICYGNPNSTVHYRLNLWVW